MAVKAGVENAVSSSASRSATGGVIILNNRSQDEKNIEENLVADRLPEHSTSQNASGFKI